MARKLALIGFLCGFGVGLGRCAPATLEPPYLVVRVFQQSGFSGGAVHGYVFTISKGDFDVLGDLRRPEEPSPTPLTNSETLRVVFPADYSGQLVELTVYALDKSGANIGFGKKSVVVTAAAEVVAEVGIRDLLKPDAGSSFDAGVITACGCDGGCCNSDGGCHRPQNFPIVQDAGVYLSVSLCGVNGYTCGKLCDFPYANACVNGGCRCGLRAACDPGEWCVTVGGVPRCVCNEATGCAGCCNKDAGQCLRGDDNLACGRGGSDCTNCPVFGTLNNGCKKGAGDERSYGYCLGSGVFACNDPNRCVTGYQCVPTSGSTTGNHFPRCRSKETPAVCISCDLWRSDRCSSDFDNGCSCGTNGTCPIDQYCLNDAGVCLPIFGGL